MKNLFKIVLVFFLFLSFGIVARAADVNLTVRDGGTIVFSGAISLPTGVTSINDDTNTAQTVDPNSVLAVINSAAATPRSTFSVSDIVYYSSFNSLYLKCITDSVGNECDNWQYVVNGSSPSDGMDKTILSGGENVYVYFGPQSQITLSSASITTNDTLTATAQNYDYQNNTWTPANGTTIGIIQPNSYPAVEIQTKTVDANGQAVFSSIPAGSYSVGIQPDYFPTESLTVTTPTPTPAPVNQGSTEGGGFLANTISTTPISVTPTTKTTFDISKAMDFLVAEQKDDGSFGEDLYTDWTAIALATENSQGQVLKLIKYLEESNVNSTNLTDYERRAMALMSLGLNPYSTNGENYIDKIVASFDGKQFGDQTEDSDDIFALIVLQNAGYTINDSMIATDINFVLGKQNQDGSWDESVDMTGAAIESLSAFNQNTQAVSSLSKAENFLKQTEESDGSWNESASSTAWAIEGILALDEKPQDWIKTGGDGNTDSPLDYLATMQDADGGIKDPNIQNKIWETAYVVSSLSGQDWNQTMQTFVKVETPIKKASVVSAPKQENKEITSTSRATQKTETPPSENTASAINAISPETPNTTAQNTPSSKNWFVKLLESIF